jgi:hypothetical protein
LRRDIIFGKEVLVPVVLVTQPIRHVPIVALDIGGTAAVGTAGAFHRAVGMHVEQILQSGIADKVKTAREGVLSTSLVRVAIVIDEQNFCVRADQR